MESSSSSREEAFALQFINSLRTHIEYPKIPTDYAQHIDGAFEKVLSSVLRTDDRFPISLLICQSCTKYSQVLPIKTGPNHVHYYLVFDKHLSNINRLMAALYFSYEDPGHDIWKLSYELFTEEALDAGEEMLATYFGLNKIALGEFRIDEEACEYDADFVGSIQDLYILGHEIGHYVYDLFMDRIPGSKISISTDLGKMAEEVKGILEDVYEGYKELFKDKEYEALLAEQEQVIREESRIIEECIADAISYAVIFTIVSEEFPDDPEKRLQAIQAVFLELMNLQLLAMHHMTVSEESFENSTSIRLAFFRNYAAAYFDDDESVFTEMLQKTVARYEERITNLMLECFSELERRSGYLFDTFTNPDGSFNYQQIIGLV